MSILVTGGAGFIGSHLVDRFVEAGERVLIIDNLSTGDLSNVEAALSTGRATFAYADVAAPAAELRAVVEGAGFSGLRAIYHLASPASPEAYGANMLATLAVNGIGTLSCIELALEADAMLMYSSTSEAYGDPAVHPQPETYFGNVNPVGPRSCYDEGKRFGEAAVAAAMRERGLRGKIVRLFNSYGPRMAGGDGRLIPALLDAVSAGKPMPIHGTGQQTRSMTFVDDVVDGILRVAAHDAVEPFPVNLGSTEERTVLSIAQEVARAAGVAFTVDALPARPEDPQRRLPDVSRAATLGWQPSTSLADGIEATLAWYAARQLTYV